MTTVGSGGDQAELMGMRFAKALLIVCRNGTNVDRELLRRWCVSAIHCTLESGANSGGLLLALVRSWGRRENIEQLFSGTCEENKLVSVLIGSY
jgi:hypothetical protein